MKIFLANPPCRIPIGKGKEKFFVRVGSRWPFSVTKRFNEKPEYIPFPGTRYYDEVKNKGLLINNNWEDFDRFSGSVVRFEGLSKKEVIDFCQKASG